VFGTPPPRGGGGGFIPPGTNPLPRWGGLIPGGFWDFFGSTLSSYVLFMSSSYLRLKNKNVENNAIK